MVKFLNRVIFEVFMLLIFFHAFATHSLQAQVRNNIRLSNFAAYFASSFIAGIQLLYRAASGGVLLSTRVHAGDLPPVADYVPNMEIQRIDTPFYTLKSNNIDIETASGTTSCRNTSGVRLALPCTQFGVT
jgi:hypothetical protein